jgi:hypothetical protein
MAGQCAPAENGILGVPMHRMAIAALFAFLACLVPNIASARVVGSVSVGYENTQFDNNCSYDGEGGCYYYYNDVDHYDGPFISASVVGPLHGDDGPWIVQGDARLQSANVEYNDYGSGYNYHGNVGHAAVHVAYRTDTYAVGGFYALENYYGDDVQEIGVEGQMYFSNVTLQGSAAYGKHEDSCGGCQDDYNAWDAHARLTYYFNDSWSASGDLGYARWDYTGGDTELTSITLAGEYRIPNSNFSIRGGYTYGDASDTYNDYTTNMFQLAVVLDFGADGARDRDQHGASLMGADAFDQDWRQWQPSYYY